MSEVMYKVNLLPPKLQREELVDVRRLLLISAVTVLGVVLLGACGFFAFSYFTMRNDIAAATQQLAALQPTVAYVENLRKERLSMESTVADYKTLLQKQITWSSLLYELDDIAPVDVWLVELDIVNVASSATGGKTAPATSATPAASSPANPAPAAGTPAKGKEAEAMPRPNTITIKGYARSVPSIGIFEKNLRQLPYFKDVTVKSINSQAEGNSFEITAYIKDEIGG